MCSKFNEKYILFLSPFHCQTLLDDRTAGLLFLPTEQEAEAGSGS